jgi:hypothetical protein
VSHILVKKLLLVVGFDYLNVTVRENKVLIQ